MADEINEQVTLRFNHQSEKKLHQKCISFDVSLLPFWLLWLLLNTQMRKKKQKPIAFVTMAILESHSLVDVAQDILIVEITVHY